MFDVKVAFSGMDNPADGKSHRVGNWTTRLLLYCCSHWLYASTGR